MSTVLVITLRALGLVLLVAFGAVAIYTVIIPFLQIVFWMLTFPWEAQYR